MTRKPPPPTSAERRIGRATAPAVPHPADQLICAAERLAHCAHSGQSTRVRFSRLGLLLGVASLLGCSSADTSDASDSQAPDLSFAVTTTSRVVQSSTSSSAVPIAPDLGSVPEPSVPMNRNVRDTPMGALCWARRNVVLVLVDQVDNSVADSAVLADALTLSIRELEQVRDRIPTEVSEFTKRFVADLDHAMVILEAAAELTAVELFDMFRFEEYPGVTSFLELAQASPSCLDI